MLQAYNEQVNFQEGENVQHITCETTEFDLHEMEKETVSKYTGDIHIATSYIAHLKRLALKFAQVAVEVANRVSLIFGKLFPENEPLRL